MFTWIEHGEHARLREVGQSQVPFALHILCTNLVDFLEGIKVCDSNLCWGQSNDGSILLMEGVNIEDPLPCDYRSLETKMSEASVPRSWEMSCGTCEANIEKLTQ